MFLSQPFSLSPPRLAPVLVGRGRRRVRRPRQPAGYCPQRDVLVSDRPVRLAVRLLAWLLSEPRMPYLHALGCQAGQTAIACRYNKGNDDLADQQG